MPTTPPALAIQRYNAAYVSRYLRGNRWAYDLGLQRLLRGCICRRYIRTEDLGEAEVNDISENRKAAIELARSFGWSVTRKSSKTWEFTRPDTGGLYDIFRIAHAILSVASVLTKLEAYDPEKHDGTY